MIEELRSRFAELKKRFNAFVPVVNEEQLVKKIENIDRKSMEEPDFWTKKESKSIIKEQANSKRFLEEFRNLKRSMDDAEVLSELCEEDEEGLKGEFEDSIKNLQKLIDDFELKLILSGENDPNNAIVTIHSGAGGTEANDWANMLLRMYLMWVENKKFKYEILDFIPGDETGVKSVTFNVVGSYAYGYLKGETGIHRLVRLSPFDANNKRHTSFASTFVLPEIDDDLEINIVESDLKIDTYRASGAGGQHVNTTDSAVRITHLPTNIVVTCQSERSQYKNKAHAMKILKAKLYELEMEKRNKEKSAVENNKTEIGWGNQIRSYVMHPYKMVKDLRTRHETGNVDAVMDGDLDDFIKSYLFYIAGIGENEHKG